jgi:hypothetical protein
VYSSVRSDLILLTLGSRSQIVVDAAGEQANRAPYIPGGGRSS